MKYIDADRLRAEIERRLDELNPKTGMFGDRPLRAVNPKTFPRERELEKVLGLIDSLQQEQPEVDLEKSRNLIRATLNGVTRLGSLCDDQTIEHAVDNLVNELGLNARKEE